MVGNMFGVLCKMVFPSKDDELGPGIDFGLLSLLLSPAGAAVGKYHKYQMDSCHLINTNYALVPIKTHHNPGAIRVNQTLMP